MAFQGKGIFDGFSGKVGDLMGYKRNGKSIIQAIGKRKGNVSRMLYELESVTFINGVNVFAINDIAIRTGTTTVWTNGAISPYGFNTQNGALEFEDYNGLGSYMVCLGNDTSTYSYVTQQFCIRVHLNQWYVRVNNVKVSDWFPSQAGQKFKIVIKYDGAYFYTDNGTGSYELKHKSTVKMNLPFYGILSMSGINSSINKLKMGATSKVFL